jgi:hypothetical protein
MTTFFITVAIDWQNYDYKSIQNQLSQFANEVFHVSGVYDFLVKINENDKTLASEKLDKLRNMSGVNHTMTLEKVDGIDI